MEEARAQKKKLAVLFFATLTGSQEPRAVGASHQFFISEVKLRPHKKSKLRSLQRLKPMLLVELDVVAKATTYKALFVQSRALKEIHKPVRRALRDHFFCRSESSDPLKTLLCRGAFLACSGRKKQIPRRAPTRTKESACSLGMTSERSAGQARRDHHTKRDSSTR